MSEAMDPVTLSLAFGFGVVLGAAYFAGLWVTARALARARRPLAVLLASALVRLALVFAGFYWMVDRGWQGLLACLLGFLVARLLATRWAGVAVARGETTS